MTDITRILQSLLNGNSHAAEELLPIVYRELRQLAQFHLQRERPDHTLQPTALVHEAYLKMLGPSGDNAKPWSSSSHFFAAAATAMRRILIDHARAAATQKRGGDHSRRDWDAWEHPAFNRPEKLLALDESLQRLAEHRPDLAQLVELRFFVGLSHREAAEALQISASTADRRWAYARAWLQTDMADEEACRNVQVLHPGDLLIMEDRAMLDPNPHGLHVDASLTQRVAGIENIVDRSVAIAVNGKLPAFRRTV